MTSTILIDPTGSSKYGTRINFHHVLIVIGEQGPSLFVLRETSFYGSRSGVLSRTIKICFVTCRPLVSIDPCVPLLCFTCS